MKIGKSTEYALLSAVHIAENYKEGRILSHQISKEYNIPLEYLLKILQQLTRANVLRSKRGCTVSTKLGQLIGRDFRRF